MIFNSLSQRISMIENPFSVTFLTEVYVFLFVKISYTFNAKRQLHSLKVKKDDLLKYRETGPRTSIEEIGIKRGKDENTYTEIIRSPEYILGEFDQDGYILPNRVSIDSLPVIDEEHFLPRKKFKIYLVATYGFLGVRKHYNGNVFRFISELQAYSKLQGRNINIPSIIDVDFNHLSVTFSYIKGPTIRESLYNIGAVIIDREMKTHPELYKYPDKNRWLIQSENKSASLYTVVDTQFVKKLFQEIQKIHDGDIYINDVKYGNIIIESSSGNPYLIDFETSRDLSVFGNTIKEIMKNHETELFNSLFFPEKGRSLLYSADPFKKNPPGK